MTFIHITRKRQLTFRYTLMSKEGSENLNFTRNIDEKWEYLLDEI